MLVGTTNRLRSVGGLLLERSQFKKVPHSIRSGDGIYFLFGTSRKVLLYVRYVIFQRLMSLKNYFGILSISLRLSTTVEAMLVISQTIVGGEEKFSPHYV